MEGWEERACGVLWNILCFHVLCVAVCGTYEHMKQGVSLYRSLLSIDLPYLRLSLMTWKHVPSVICLTLFTERFLILYWIWWFVLASLLRVVFNSFPWVWWFVLASLLRVVFNSFPKIVLLVGCFAILVSVFFHRIVVWYFLLVTSSSEMIPADPPQRIFSVVGWIRSGIWLSLNLDFVDAC